MLIFVVAYQIICRDRPNKDETKSKLKEEKVKKTIGDLAQRLRIKITGLENIDTYNNKYNDWVSQQKKGHKKEKEKKGEVKEKKKGKTKLYVHPFIPSFPPPQTSPL